MHLLSSYLGNRYQKERASTVGELEGELVTKDEEVRVFLLSSWTFDITGVMLTHDVQSPELWCDVLNCMLPSS